MTQIASELKEIMNFHINFSWPVPILALILQPLKIIFKCVQMVQAAQVGVWAPRPLLCRRRGLPAEVPVSIPADGRGEALARTNVWFQAAA